MPVRFQLDTASGVPFYRQVIDQVLAGIATGALSRGERLPTVRALAVELAVNLNTVARAYKELEIRGVLATQQGSGTFVASESMPDFVAPAVTLIGSAVASVGLSASMRSSTTAFRSRP